MKTSQPSYDRFCHAQGMKRAEITRASVMAVLESMRADGLTQAELIQRIDGVAVEKEVDHA